MSILVTVTIVLLLVCVSAMCSGLNVALMSLGIDDLRRKKKLGNARAERVYPFRKNTHLSLAAILLTNVAAVSAATLVLESVLFGLIAGLITTIIMVIFGEIFPQALFSRKALTYTAFFTPALRLMIIFTYPVSKPLQLLLDRLFEQPSSQLHSRQELGILIREHRNHAESELDDDEVEIINGALQLSEKRVSDILMPIEHVYWLTPDTLLSPEKIDEIKEVGRSRIPIFNPHLNRCYGVLLMKDLVDMDFDENEYHVADIPLHPVQLVGSRTALDTLLRKFIANSSHLIPVEKEDKIIGIATIEDLIEEIVGHEIEDETDRNRRNVQAADSSES